MSSAGVAVPSDGVGMPERVFEITPLRGFDCESFLANPKNHNLDSPTEGQVL